MKKYIGVFAFTLVVVLISIMHTPISFGDTPAPLTGSNLCKYPAGGSYAVSGTNGASYQASCKYSPTVPGITFGEIPNDVSGSGPIANFSLGSSNKFLYYYPTGTSNNQGPVGRFDITDPMNPKAPDVVEITKAPGCVGGGTGPVDQYSCGHDAGPQYFSVAEQTDGSARAVFFPQPESGRSIGLSPDPNGNTGISAVKWGSTGGGSFGQQVNDDEAQASWSAGQHKNVVSDVTAAGKFFSYVPSGFTGPVGINTPASSMVLKILAFDLTTLSGSASAPYIASSGSIPWSAIPQLQILRVPGVTNHFLLGRSFTSDNTATIHLAELDADTGLSVKTNIQSFSVSTKTTDVNAFWGSEYTMKSAVVNGSVYVFMIDSFPSTNSFYYSMGGKGTMVVGVYKFNPTTLALTKISSVNFPDVNSGQIEDVELAADPAGGAYPILISPINDDSKWALPGGVWPGSNKTAQGQGGVLRFYSTKPFLTTGTYTPTPNFSFSIEKYKWPLAVGDPVNVQEPYRALLKNENGKTNLYLYRAYFTHKGQTTYYESIHDFYPGPTSADDSYGLNWIDRGALGVRVDKIDVTNINTTTSASSNLPLPPSPSGSCTAVLSFDKTSVSSGDSMTENWTVDGADIGQVFGDCGAGEIPISAGPKSFIFSKLTNLTNTTKTMTCRVYGKIDGQEACSASATVTITPLASSSQTSTNTTSNTTSGLDNIISGNPDIMMPAAAGSYDFGTTTLRQGSSGAAVSELQTFLNASAGADLVVDGKFGPLTTAAVEQWQSNAGLVVDGLVGVKTKSKMNAEN